jgi:maleylpyruvate isomerase
MISLYSYWRSSASWRVRIALGLKGVAFEYRAVHLGGEQHAPEYAAKNPMQQVPTLVLESGQRISQSMAILEYLEETIPEPPLLPKEPWLRARARQLAEIVNSGVQPFQNTPSTSYVKDVLHGDEKAFARHFIGRGLAALERTAAETAGQFLVGDAPSFADVCLVPQLYGARRFGVDLAPLPLLVRVEAACDALPAFAAAHADRQPDKPPRDHK